MAQRIDNDKKRRSAAPNVAYDKDPNPAWPLRPFPTGKDRGRNAAVKNGRDYHHDRLKLKSYDDGPKED